LSSWSGNLSLVNLLVGTTLEIPFLTSTTTTGSTFAGLVTLSGGLTIQDGDTFTFSGDAFTDFTGDATIEISSGALRVKDLNCTNCIGETEISDVYLVNNANDSTTGQLTAANFVANGSATSTGTNGWDLTAGCFALNGTCVRKGAFDKSFQLASSTLDTSLNSFNTASTTFLLISPSQAGNITTVYCKSSGPEVLMVLSLNGTATSGPPISCNGAGRTVTLTSNNVYAARDDIRAEILSTTTAEWIAPTITFDEGD